MNQFTPYLAVCDSESVNKVCEKLKLDGADNFMIVPSGVEFIPVIPPIYRNI